jgi:Zn finger protein HypA/HybF involved in hydrogenase expression
MPIKIDISNYSSDGAQTFYTGPPMHVDVTCTACGHVEHMENVTEMKGGVKCPACGNDTVSVKIY